MLQHLWHTCLSYRSLMCRKRMVYGDGILCATVVLNIDCVFASVYTCYTCDVLSTVYYMLKNKVK